MSAKRITICGKHWGLRYIPMRKTDGECDHPSVCHKEIRIACRLRRFPRAWTDALIHEILHAAHWELSEEAVDQLASDIARILDAEGCLRE
jgi:hypothetical protein